MYGPDDPLRAALAEQAARQILRGCSPAALYPRLRRHTTGELLAEAQRAPLCGHALALPATLDALLCAAQLAVRRRPGWLQVAGLREIPADFPVCVRATLLQAAMLCFFRDCLLCGAVASVRCRAVRGAVLLRLSHSLAGYSTETTTLLSALAYGCGGSVLFNIAGSFAAVLRLPAASAPLCASPSANDLLSDRFSPLYLYLHGQCADPWE